MKQEQSSADRNPIVDCCFSAMRIAFRAIAFLLVALVGFVTYAGYFDDEVLLDVPATGPPVTGHSHLAAVYFSGDVGYKVAMGGMIGSRLAADGIPVVAVNSMGYFRQHRTIAEVTALIEKAIRQALALGSADQIILIGHSLGADALQASLVHLPQDLRARVRVVVLIVPTDAIYLQISPGEMLDWSRPDAEALSTLRQLTWAPVTCIFGSQESDSPCPQLTAPNVRKVPLPGGHALGWNVNAVHEEILHSIDTAPDTKITNSSGPDNLAAMPKGAEGGHTQAQ